MSISSAFIEHETAYKEEIMVQTWGHLAPIKNKSYEGHIIYTCGCFGNDHLNPTVLVCKFKGLDSSPWFYDALQEFVGDEKYRPDTGIVFKFNGKFKNYKFIGSIEVLFDAN